MVTGRVVEGPSMGLDEGLDHVVRLAGTAAVAQRDADALAAAVIKGAALKPLTSQTVRVRCPMASVVASQDLRKPVVCTLETLAVAAC